MTAKKILYRWLETALAHNDSESIVIRSSDIQTRLPSWGNRVYGEQYAPNNYIRRFREIKADDHQDELHRNTGIKSIEKVNLKGSREAGWKITKSISHVPRNFDVHRHQEPVS